MWNKIIDIPFWGDRVPFFKYEAGEHGFLYFCVIMIALVSFLYCRNIYKGKYSKFKNILKSISLVALTNVFSYFMYVEYYVITKHISDIPEYIINDLGELILVITFFVLVVYISVLSILQSTRRATLLITYVQNPAFQYKYYLGKWHDLAYRVFRIFGFSAVGLFSVYVLIFYISVTIVGIDAEALAADRIEMSNININEVLISTVSGIEYALILPFLFSVFVSIYFAVYVLPLSWGLSKFSKYIIPTVLALAPISEHLMDNKENKIRSIIDDRMVQERLVSEGG